MASDEENNYQSDDDINSGQHTRFLEDIFQLDKKQFVKKPTRTEPTTHVSEFNLVKSSADRHNIVNIGDLAKSLEKTKNVEISKKIKSARTKVATLRKPLEKPQRERIKRDIGYKEVKLDLAKWDPIVKKNRVTSQLFFPLNEGGMDIHKGKEPAFKLKIKSKLDEELEKLEPVVEKEENFVETFPLTLKEILDKRREMARLRAQQSYQEAKYHRQNKIKSKKFHRIQRKEKIKNQIKDFEKLQKTDPEEALKKLEEIDRARAEERMSLRHRSTGQWAKNKSVRAKYDKESRQILAQQLSISRDLTQKLRTESSSESDDEPSDNLNKRISDPNNPWVNNIKTDQEINDFVSGYRKYWDEQNKTQNKNETNDNKKKSTSNEDAEDINIEEIQETEEITKSSVVPKNKKLTKEKSVKKPKLDEKKKEKLKKKLDSLDLSSLLQQKMGNKKIKKKKETKMNCITTEWKVESLNEDNQEDIEEMFDDLETITKDKLKRKLNIVRSNLNEKSNHVVKENKTKKKKKNLKNEKKKSKTKNYLELPREKHRPEIDEELIIDDDNEKVLRKLSQLSSLVTEKASKNKKDTSENANIDPNKYMNAPTNLDTFLPNNIDMGDDNNSDEDEASDTNQRAKITEAFAGDDIVSDFIKEKKDIIDSEKPQDVDLTLPGWGSWGGKNIQPSKRKRKRFIVKFPKNMPRRDENKGQVIINEAKNIKLQQHLVSEIPFPFRSVKDFEASIRAPIGETFVPQTAFRRLIKPAVVTKKGEIIKPMDDEVLLKNKFTKNGMVVKI